MANKFFKCGEFEFAEDRIMMPCISMFDKMLHICETNYKNDDLTICKLYKFDIKIQDDFDYEYLSLRIKYYITSTGKYLSFVNFYIEDSDIPKYDFKKIDLKKTDIFQRFFLISDKLQISYDIPIDNFYIDSLYMIASNSFEKIRKLLITSRNGAKLDVIVMNLQRSVLDIDSISQGFFKSGIEMTMAADDIIVFFDTDPVMLNLTITIFDLSKMSSKNIVIDKQIEILDIDIKNDLIFLQTRNTKYTVETFIVNTTTTRIFVSDTLYYQDNQSMILFNRENQFYFNVVQFDVDSNKLNIKMFKIFDMNNIFFQYRPRNMLLETMKNKNEVEALIDISYKKMPTIAYKANFIDMDFMYTQDKSSIIQGRTFNEFSYYIQILKNNLQTNINDPSFLLFNAVHIRFSEKVSIQLEDCKVMISYSKTRYGLVCKDNTIITKKLKYFPSEKGLTIRQFTKKLLSYNIFKEEAELR